MKTTQLYYRLDVHPVVFVHGVKTGEFFSRAVGCCTTSHYQWALLQTEPHGQGLAAVQRQVPAQRLRQELHRFRAGAGAAGQTRLVFSLVLLVPAKWSS